jgi:glycerophosphoryl diester phosphodiesterase
MKIYIYILAAVFLLNSCNTKSTLDKNEELGETLTDAKQNKTISIQEKIANLKNSHNKEIIVVAHRADWRNAPENSLRAIQNCIDMGVDMIEIDVRKTKDGHLVLMHDKTIDRTTTGTGLVSDITFEELQKLFLMDGTGQPTRKKVPTLKEALELSKDKILVNLDKSYDIFDKCFEVVKETGMQDQVIIKGAKSIQVVESEFGEYLDKVLFMPVIKLPDTNEDAIIKDYMNSENPPVAFEFVFEDDSIDQISKFKFYRDSGISVWVNSLWAHLCGGHDDESASENVNNYQWYIDNNVDIIQTDRPELLLKFLRSKNLHN